DPDALVVERRQQLIKAAPLFAEQRVLADAHALVENLERARALEDGVDLVQRHARRVARHQEHAHAARRLLALGGARDHDQIIGEVGLRRERLCAVEDPAAGGIAARARAQRAEHVGAAARLGDRQREAQAAAAQLGQEAPLLLLGAERADRLAAEADGGEVRPDGGGERRQHLERETHVDRVAAHAAVRRVGGDAEQAGVGDLAPHRLVVAAGGGGALDHVDAALAPHERAHLVAERRLLGREIEVHRYSAASSAMRRTASFCCAPMISVPTLDAFQTWNRSRMRSFGPTRCSASTSASGTAAIASARLPARYRSCTLIASPSKPTLRTYSL